MKMNKKGQVIIYGVMLFVFAFIAAVLMLKPMISIGDDVRTDLECDLDNRTQGTYLSCIGIDIFPALFFLAIIAAGAGLVTMSKGG